MSVECTLFDSRDVEDLANAWREELDEDERSEKRWTELVKEAREDVKGDFEDLKDALVQGIPKGDMVLLIARDGSESELCRPEELFGKWDNLWVYYEDGDIWITKLDRYDAEYRVLWVPAQKGNVNLPEDVEEDLSNLYSVASMGLDASDTTYMLDLCDTKSLAPVFSKVLAWNGVHYCEEIKNV